MNEHNILRRIGWSLVCTATLLGGCAHYAALPLQTRAQLAPSVTALQQAPGSSPLTIDQVVSLALANSPDLKAVRLKRGVAQAQFTQAGILPNPVLSGAFLPLISGAGSVPAWSIGLSQNIRAIVTYRSHQRAAGDAAQQVDADIVWQEWQTAGQARQLAADLIFGERSRPTYVAAYNLLAQRSARLETALAAGNITLSTIAPDRVALQAAHTALNALDQRQLSLTHRLDAVLGLAPDGALPLVTTIDLPAFDAAAIRAQIGSLPDRRPDLLALRMGYAQSDEQVRSAILSQFPDLVLGASTSSDNARVINGGANISVGLPVFDRNQGTIEVARATRAQLHADYTARLASATGQAKASLGEIEQLGAQLKAVQHELPDARRAAEQAAQAFGAGNLDERAYVDLIVNRFTKEEDVMTLELALLDRQIALQTLMGTGFPTVGLPPSAGMGIQP